MNYLSLQGMEKIRGEIDTDVNKLTYEEFFNLIFQEKSKHCVPNIIFNYGKPCSHCPLSATH